MRPLLFPMLTLLGLAMQQPVQSPDTDPSEPTNLRFCRLAADYSAAHRGISLVVMLDGQIIFEDYPNGGFAARPHELASGTKSFAGVLAATAAADGLLTLDENVSDTITEWRDDARKARITVRELLSLTAGLETGDERGRVPTYADALRAPTFAEPGEQFRYGAVPFQVFGEVMRRKLGGQSPLDYLQRRVLDPIGLHIGRWRHGADGNPQWPSGAALTAREWAKFGEFVRAGGRWEGKQIIPQEQLDECFRGSRANPAYGLTWWLRPDTDLPPRAGLLPRIVSQPLRRAPAIPKDLVMAAGAGDQRLYVIRSLRLVIVRQATGILQALASERSGFSDAEFLSLLLRGQARSAWAPERGANR